jgi:hypothetical protein
MENVVIAFPGPKVLYIVKGVEKINGEQPTYR